MICCHWQYVEHSSVPCHGASYPVGGSARNGKADAVRMGLFDNHIDIQRVGCLPDGACNRAMASNCDIGESVWRRL
jgi:hypothetical protein